jgi:hypothetical protein
MRTSATADVQDDLAALEPEVAGAAHGRLAVRARHREPLPIGVRKADLEIGADMALDNRQTRGGVAGAVPRRCFISTLTACRLG